MKQFTQYSTSVFADRDTIITREQFIDFVNWLGAKDVLVREDGNGWFRVQFINTAETDENNSTM